MRIEKILIHGFGNLHDLSLDLSPGMNIIFGANESGKTTLFEFIHRILFGFPKGKKKKDYNPYSSVMKNKTGGRLILNCDKAGAVAIERYDGDKSGNPALTYSDGSAGAEDELIAIFGPITPDMYRDVFAFGLQELWDLQEESLKRFYGAGLGLKNVFVSDVLNYLENKAQEIYKPTRGETRIKKNIDSLHEIQKEINALSRQKEQYDDISLNLKKIETKLESVRKSHDQLRDRLEHDNTLKKALPPWVELVESEKELSALPRMTDFPEQALIRMERLEERVKQLEIQEISLRENLERVEKDHDGLHKKFDALTPELKERYPSESLLDILDEYQKETSLVIVLLSSLKEKNHRMETFEERKRSLQSQLTMAQMTRTPAIHTAYLPGLVAPFALAITGVVLLFLGFGAFPSAMILIVAIILALAHVAYAYLKLKDARDGENLFEPLRKEIDACDLSSTSLKDEIEKDNAEIAERAGKIGLSPHPTIEELENKRIVLNRIASQFRDYKKEKDALASALSDVGAKMQAARKELAQLLNAAHATDAETFRLNARIMDKRNQLEESIKTARKNLAILGCGDMNHLKEELDKTSLEEINKRITETHERLSELGKIMDDLRQNKGELLEKKRALVMDRIPELRLSRERILSEIDALAKQWRVYRLASIFLRKAREKYERDKQPRVLHESGVFFKKMSQAKYHRIGFSQENKAFMVFDSLDRVKDPLILSRGAREQMYLAIRFGLIKSFELNGVILPVMTDDVLANFDPGRALGAAEAFCELSKTHQILFFTCHPETVEVFKKLSPEIEILNI